MTTDKHLFLAIDIGSGLTKYRTDSSIDCIPTAVGISKDSDNFELGTKHYEVIYHNNQKYLIGEAAIANLDKQNIETSTCKTWCEKNAQLIIAFSVIAKLYPSGFNGTVSLGLGLPIAVFGKQKNNYTSMFEGNHEFTAGGAHYSISVDPDKIVVLPQVLGLHFKNVIDNSKDDPDFGHYKYGYIDPGTYTCGYAVIDNGTFFGKLSGGDDKGMFHLGQKVKTQIKARTGSTPSCDYEVLKVLRDGVFHYFKDGKKVKITSEDLVGNCAEDVFKTLLDEINDKWQGGLNMKIFVSSGGGQYIINSVKARFPHAELMHAKKKTKSKTSGKDKASSVSGVISINDLLGDDVSEHYVAIFDVVEGIFHFAKNKLSQQQKRQESTSKCA